MRKYIINYYEDGDFQPISSEEVLATNIPEAYKKFMDNHNWTVYSAWVAKAVTRKGKERWLNNFSGKAY